MNAPTQIIITDALLRQSLIEAPIVLSIPSLRRVNHELSLALLSPISLLKRILRKPQPRHLRFMSSGIDQSHHGL